MSTSTRPSKRRRDETGTGGGEAPRRDSEIDLDCLKRSDEFWIADGNIVLVAGETAFRIYRGLLALQSTVFSDLFESSSPNAEERYDDCPVIRITDSPEDLTHLLRVLLPASRTLFHRRKSDPPTSCEEVFAIIRLAHKYDIEDLLNQALSSLQESVTASFKVWDDKSHVAPVPVDNHDAIAVVNIARLTDTPSLLPLALYKCCNMGGAVIDGRVRADGSVEYLSLDDLKRCINGRNALVGKAFSLISTIFDPTPSVDCTTRLACRSGLREALAWILRHMRGTIAEPDVLETWASFIHQSAGSPGRYDAFCSACEKEVIARDVRERERIWNLFPEIFDVEVPNWNEDALGEHGQGNGDSDGHSDSE